MIKTLDFYVKETLKKLNKWKYPKLKIKESPENLFLGSGNAFNVGLLFSKKFDGRALNVSEYKQFFSKRRKNLNIYLISASGGKDAVKMAKFLKKKKLSFYLLTNNPEAPAARFTENEKIFVFPSFKEPPTYNVSTYSSMIYHFLKEKKNLRKIRRFIEKIKVPNLRRFKYILFVSEDEFEPIARMCARKVVETFENVGSHAEPFSDAVHGFFVQPNKYRLLFCINQKCEVKGEKYELFINSHLGALLSAYYIIGKNQTKKDSMNILKKYKEIVKKQKWELKGIV